MTRKARFGWWVAAVVGALASPLWMVLGGSEKVWLMVATAQSLVSLTGMVWLLRTTPWDAMRLPGWVSAAVIGAGFLWLTNVPVRAPQKFFVLAFGLLVILLVASMRAEWKSRLWTMALVLWHPAMAVYAHDGVAAGSVASYGLMISIVGAFTAAHFVAKRERGMAAWACWGVSVVGMVWAVM